jgi:hypothetical protein
MRDTNGNLRHEGRGDCDGYDYSDFAHGILLRFDKWDRLRPQKRHGCGCRKGGRRRALGFASSGNYRFQVRPGGNAKTV